ncbi:lysophosphatidic acid receptor 5-like [Heptranchias perlo]|uniref:lysophosphatidic acid receptor 5-like n=1 Tax=Heptranchias perlo TaxID=212740 RepID=UPI003559AEEE
MEGNGTDAPLPPCKDHDQIHRLHLVWYTLLFLLGLSLNGTALWVFLRCFKLGTVVTVYMFNLAACDLLFTLTLPLRIYYYATDAWPFGDVPCQIAGSLFQINMYGSCLFLACINVDRYLALVYPLKARHLRRLRTARRVCAAIWTVIALGCVPVAFIHEASRCQANETTEVRCFESFSKATWREEILPLVGLAEVLGFLLPLGVVLYCSTRTLVALRRQRGPPTRRWRKTTQLLLANVSIFVVCFVPYNLTLATYGLTKARLVSSSLASQAHMRLALQITMLLASSNCCLDPLIYYFSTEGFRSTFKSKRPSPSEGAQRTRTNGQGEGGRTHQGRPPAGQRQSWQQKAVQTLVSKTEEQKEGLPIVFEEESPRGGSQGSNGVRESVI